MSNGAQLQTPGDRIDLTQDDIEHINAVLTAEGRGALPEGTTALEITSDEVARPLDSAGNQLGSPAASDTFQARNAVIDEIVEVVAACLGTTPAGLSLQGVLEQINTWQKAAKFVLRRIGLFAAISCGGGIFAHYLL
ncbi:hypothetical protein IQ251_00585 [Saccharopolyspora sp. HNM0983]|uniref:Uncharacterized protein n=1 Tax=Saccharopolyspora montiporae TaxID=2781240 RepID=A0A929B4D0_9PSEU|nr:hypothetical protein [Saccharopolyspora sp. HNM0983]MBE9372934.1 hypothetical protein [Saccharopolyspora sp. HNM0983]